MSSLKVAFLIPTNRFQFYATCVRMNISNNQIIIGNESGEILIYSTSNHLNKLNICASVLMIPHYGQRAGWVVDMIIITFPQSQIINSSKDVLLSIHSDNRLRLWNTNDGKCISISLHTLFSTSIQQLILISSSDNKMNKHYVLCVGTSNKIYLVDAWTMRLIAIYTAPFLSLSAAYYEQSTNQLYVFDSKSNVWVWEILNENYIREILEKNDRVIEEEALKLPSKYPIYRLFGKPFQEREDDDMEVGDEKEAIKHIDINAEYNPNEYINIDQGVGENDDLEFSNSFIEILFEDIHSVLSSIFIIPQADYLILIGRRRHKRPGFVSRSVSLPEKYDDQEPSPITQIYEYEDYIIVLTTAEMIWVRKEELFKSLERGGGGKVHNVNNVDNADDINDINDIDINMHSTLKEENISRVILEWKMGEDLLQSKVVMFGFNRDNGVMLSVHGSHHNMTVYQLSPPTSPNFMLHGYNYTPLQNWRAQQPILPINPNIKSHTPLSMFKFFYKDEIVTTTAYAFPSNMETPIYIIGTNYGRIFIIPIFITNTKRVNPILLVECHSSRCVNNLFIIKNKLISTSIDGSLGVTDLSKSKLQRAWNKYHTINKNRKTMGTVSEIPNLQLSKMNSIDVPLIRDRSASKDWDFNASGHYIKYQEQFSSNRVLPAGIIKVIEIKSITNEEDIFEAGFVTSFYKDSYAEECIALIGADYSLAIFNISTLNVLHTLKGHDSDIKGIYIQEQMNYLLVLTKKLTLYVYSVSSNTLERRANVNFAYEIFNLETKVLPVVNKQNVNMKYAELLRLNKVKLEPFKRGSNPTLDFYSHLYHFYINFRDIPVYRIFTYSTEYKLRALQGETKTENMTKATLLKVHNSVNYMGSQLFGQINGSLDEGVLGIISSIGELNFKEENKAKKNNSLFKGKLKKSNQHVILILYLDDILKKMEANYRHIHRENTTGDIGTEEEIKDHHSASITNEKSLEANLIHSLTSESIWPLPLLSLLHCFGINSQIDGLLENEFSICAPMLDMWIGQQGVGESFAFVFPKYSVGEGNTPDKTSMENTSRSLFQGSMLSQVSNNWKITSNINSLQMAFFFTPFVKVIHSHQEFLASVINHILEMYLRLFSAKRYHGLPFPSFPEISRYMMNTDSSLWSTGRDILLQPFMKISDEKQLGTGLVEWVDLLMGSYEQLKGDAEYTKFLSCFYEEGPMRFDHGTILNKYFGELEMRALTLISYSTNTHSSLYNPNVIKRCAKLIVFLIGEISAKYEKYKHLLINLEQILGNNFPVFESHYKGCINQLIRLILQIYLTHSIKTSGVESQNLVLKLNCDKYTLIKSSNITYFLRNTSAQTILAIGEHFYEEIIEIIQHEIFRPDINPLYPSELLDLLRIFVKRFSIKLVKFLTSFAKIILKCMDPHETALRKHSHHSVTVFLYTMVQKFPEVAFHQETQRLAIGTYDGFVVMYDLRAHSKWRILEGHKGPLNGVSFDQKGKKLASYSEEDNTIRIWHIGQTGFFSTVLGIQSKCKVINCDSTKRQEVPFKGTSTPPYVKIIFIGPKDSQVELSTKAKTTYVYKIKN